MTEFYDDKSEPENVTVQISRESLQLSQTMEKLFMEIGDGDLMVGIALSFYERIVLWGIIQELGLEKLAKQKVKESLIKGRQIASLEISLKKEVNNETEFS